MATVLDRPPTERQIGEERLSETPAVTAHDEEAESSLHWWQQLSAHDRIAALLLAIGEYGALAHGAAWAMLLGLLTDHGKPTEQQEVRVAHPAAHSGLVY
jgi:hypothetical protein